MTSGALERQLRLLRRRHVRRRDAMVAAVARHLPGATVHGVAAGLHLTVTLPGAVADTEVASAALERGVKVQPLSWHCQRPPPAGPGPRLRGQHGLGHRGGRRDDRRGPGSRPELTDTGSERTRPAVRSPVDRRRPAVCGPAPPWA
ncbi:hypothetical protein ACGF5C_12515 [Micromonospora sp. NPDC047620]|uniref:hypothetical protein n=1 Tax=Micromonospora sp. NPDC047620 TaxID=3364251 RepID=UPI00371A7E13